MNYPGSIQGNRAGGTAVAEPTARSGTTDTVTRGPSNPRWVEATEAHDALTKIYDEVDAMTNRGADAPVWDPTLDQFGTALQKLRRFLWPDAQGSDRSP